MLDLVQLVGKEISFAQSVFLAGIGLILVNLLTHRLVANYDFRARQQEQVERNLKPLLHASADLISRLVEILITQKKTMMEAIGSYDAARIEERIAGSLKTAADLNRHETTAYRLINFLTLANFFGRETAGIAAFSLLDRAEFFLQHKLAVGLRGNLYNLNFLSTELQEDLAAAYLECDRTVRAADLSAGVFLAHLKSNEYPADFFVRALDVVGLIPPYSLSQEPMDRSSREWKHTLALAHFAIYLIDFYQELAKDPQWEEHRVFFVQLVRLWNADAQRHRYLYEPGDLEVDDYLRTFPSQRTSRQSSLYFFPSVFGLRDSVSTLKKWSQLNIRGARFGRRHHPKRVTSWGVSIRVGRQRFEIRWDTDLRGTLTAVRAWLDVRLLEM